MRIRSMAAARRPSTIRRPRAAWLPLLALLSGCSINPPLRVAELPEAPATLAGVPFFAQTEYQCGPASLAGMLGAAGVDVDPEQLRPQVYLPERRGTLQLELLAATRRAGRIPYVIDREPAAISAELAAGRPVLVMQNLRTPGFPVWHYAVVVGQDPQRNRIHLNSGTHEGMTQRAPPFLRTWDWADRWGLVVLRPGELPARADPLRYAESVAAFEAVAGGEAAAPAWHAAAARWPDDHRPHLALGNAAHARRDLAAARRHYAAGLERRPGDPVLSNNLASVLGQLGCPDAGRAVLDPVVEALAPDSPWREALARTQAELSATRARCSE